tara:strand:+ start:58125 stop:59339 length:1215 start_codon:yes stop_codon:yes gene_type:complete
MKKKSAPILCLESIISSKDILIIQDIDGVCIPLVKDPLKRILDKTYINSVAKLKEEFYVLTCGEHEGIRGVNRLVEAALNSPSQAREEGLYLPGLAACGVEYQNSFGEIQHLGLSSEEIKFLKEIPLRMKELLSKELKSLMGKEKKETIEKLIQVAVCDTRFTPTINLNEILTFTKDDLQLQVKLQLMMENIMNKLLSSTFNTALENSFYLHMMPNLGKSGNNEIMKYAKKDDIGTTDIQFIINGAIKEAGLLVLLNKYIKNKVGEAPFGEDFNVRNAPKQTEKLIELCQEKISLEDMPILIGIGDTVTSNWSQTKQSWLRGGSDRGFLTLIQELGKKFKKENKVIFVNSNNHEVHRPSISESNMDGVSDSKDPLKFNAILEGGPNEYIEWFNRLAETRSIERI